MKILCTYAKWHQRSVVWAFLAVLLCVVLLFFVFVRGAGWGQDMLSVHIHPDIEMELKQLVESNRFVEAEQFAREKNLDPRIIVAVMARAGKKEEAFSMLLEFVRSVPAEIRERIALQTVGMLRGASDSDLWGEEFFAEMVRQNIVSFDNGKILIRKVDSLTRSGQIEDAAELFEQVLASDYAGDDLAGVAMLLITKMNIAGEREKVKVFLDRLVEKLPDNLNMRLQRVDSLAWLDATAALAEIDWTRTNFPEFYASRESNIRLLRANALRRLGEHDRAKSEYSALVGTNFESHARDRLEEYAAEERLEQELQEKVAQMHQPHELPARPSRPWGLILGGNAVIVAIIIYLFYWRGRKKV